MLRLLLTAAALLTAGCLAAAPQTAPKERDERPLTVEDVDVGLAVLNERAGLDERLVPVEVDLVFKQIELDELQAETARLKEQTAAEEQALQAVARQRIEAESLRLQQMHEHRVEMLRMDREKSEARQRLDRLHDEVDRARQDRTELADEVAELEQRRATSAAQPTPPPENMKPATPQPAAPLVDRKQLRAELDAGLAVELRRRASAGGYRLVRFTARTPALALTMRKSRRRGGFQPFYFSAAGNGPRFYVEVYFDRPGRRLYYRTRFSDGG